MKILDLKTHVLSTPLDEEFAFSMGWVGRRSTMMVELLTDDGVTGWGEALCHGLQPPRSPPPSSRRPSSRLSSARIRSTSTCCGSGCTTAPARSARRARCPTRSARSTSRSGTASAARRASRSTSCWAAPIAAEVQPYATGFYRLRHGNYPADAQAEARRHLDNGFTAMKLKIGFGVEEDIAYVRSVREAIGPGPKLMVDANHAYSVGAARRILKAIEPARIHWFEEPISPEDIDGYKELKSLTDIYLAAGENEFTKIGFREWISRRAVDILQPDICSAGGFTECRKISALAPGLAPADSAACLGLGHRTGRITAVRGHLAARTAGLVPHRADARIRPVGASFPAGPDLRCDHDEGRHGPDSRRTRPGRRDQSRRPRALRREGCEPRSALNRRPQPRQLAIRRRAPRAAPAASRRSLP